MTTCRGCGESLTAEDRFCPRCGIPASPATPTGGGAYSPWTQVLERLRSATSGEFHIVRELGRGGMAAVYLAQEVALNRLVAIKVMAPGVMMGEGMVDRFRQEAVTVANLSHPNIITIHTVRQLDDLHFFVMKYVDGRPLDIVLQSSGVLPIPMVRAILFQVGSGLAYAHRRGVIHRDVKPANILLDRDGNAIVTDFGIAKVAEVTGHTKTGTMVGTPAYMSPEQCVGEPVTWASDQYSLGIVAYELLTGAPPFAGSSYAIMQGHLERAPAPIIAQRPDCPPELEAGVMRMLAKDPADRFPTMAEALQAIGARPLGEDDPLRAGLAKLVGQPTGEIEGVRVPRSPIPPSRAATTPAPRAARVALSAERDTLEPGDSFTLDIAVSDSGGRPVAGRSAAWSSSDPAIATVDRGGQVRALAAGTASITARVDEVTDSLTLHVRPPSVAAIRVQAPRELLAGRRATATATPLDRAQRPLAERPVVWTSSDESVAAVDSTGIVTAHRPGSVTLTASCEGREATAALSVMPVPAASISLDEETDPLEVGEECQLRATVRDADGAPLDRPIAWRSSNVRVATVSDDGMVRALAPGKSKVTAAADRAVASTRIVVVAAGAGAGVPAAAPRSRRGWLLVGGTVLLAAIGIVLVRSRREAPSTVVTDAPAVPAPPAGAPATDTGAPPAAGRARLVVRPSALTLAVGATSQLRGGLVDAADNAVDGPAPRWSSSDRAVATVDTGGRVTAVAPGTATIVATALGRRTPVVVNVRAPRSPEAPRAATIAVSLPRPLQEGDTTTLHAVVRDSAGRRLGDDAVVWSSADPEVAGVDGTTGLVRAIKEGRTLISATADGRSQRVPIVVAARSQPARPAPVSAPPAAPATSSASAGETGVRAAANACFAAIRAGDPARMQQLYQPESERDRKNEEKLLTLMRRKEWAFATTTTEISVTPSVAGDVATGTFPVHLTWKNSFGQRREDTVTFRAEARRAADGSWNAAGCRLDGTPGF
ncbi:MAG: protein kinase domain-containing protein [Bacillota bacterium]